MNPTIRVRISVGPYFYKLIFISYRSSSSRSYNPDLYQDNECYLDVKISSRPRSSKERQRDRQRCNIAYAPPKNTQSTVEFSEDLEISDIENSDYENESYQHADYNPNDYLSTTYRSDYQYYTDDTVIRYKPIKVKEFEMQKPILYRAQPSQIQKLGKPETFTIAKPVKIKSGPVCVQTISKFTKPAQSSQNRYARKPHQKNKSKNQSKIATKTCKKAMKKSTESNCGSKISDTPTTDIDNDETRACNLTMDANLPKPLFHCQFCSLPFHSIISLRRHEMIFCTKDWTKLS